jgi:class 3 adenylate cyclase
MPQTSFEVYAFDGARWTIQQTYSGHQRQAALDFAKEIYAQEHIKGVRVVQDTFDDGEGGGSQKTILTRTKSDDVPKSLNKEIKQPIAAPGKPKPEPAKRVASKIVPDAPVPGAVKLAQGAAAKRAAEPAILAYLTPGRVIGAVAGASLLAAGGGFLMMQMPGDAALLLPLRSAFGANYFIPLAIALFGVGLIASGLAMLVSAPPRRIAPPAPVMAGTATETPAEPASAPAPVNVRFPVIDLEDDEPELPASADSDGEALNIVAFFHDCLAALPRDGVYMTDGRLDAFNWFGCHLFFAGLAEDEGQRRHWTRYTLQRVIIIGMKAALADPRNAARFAARYDDYLTEPRALAMFNRGIEASRQRHAGQAEAKEVLRLALEDWNRRENDARARDHVCVMFTDIVGSTEFAQVHGDARHFEVVQAHDRIVRTALEEYSGREIKHTGDGIMAAFDDGDLAARASLQIQREIAAHREVNPQIGMFLRIGLAAGEPIRAGSDLFGSTVQLASRACGFAQPGQVIASDSVRTVTEALNVRFTDLGEQQLKGFKQPVRVHAVVEAV